MEIMGIVWRIMGIMVIMGIVWRIMGPWSQLGSQIKCKWSPME